MNQSHEEDKNKFLDPRGHYYGQVKPEKLLFNTNLQEFCTVTN
jgi:hypothetical protein